MSFEFRKCPNCGEYAFTGSHKCKPKWYVRPDYYERDDEFESFGKTPEEAAENFLSQRFGDFDYPRQMTVIVVNESENEQYTIDIEV